MRLRIITLLSTAALLAGCGHSKPEPETAPVFAPVKASTMQAVSQEWPIIQEAVGTVRPKIGTVLSAKLMGYVREVHCQTGDRVKAGQLLITLEAREAEAQQRLAEATLAEARMALAEVDNAIAAAKAGQELARVSFERIKTLFEKKSVSGQEYDEAEARLKMSQAQHEMALSKKNQLQEKIHQAEEGVRAAQVMLSNARVTAPWDGLVVARQADPGLLAAPGVPLLTLEKSGGYRLEVAVAESQAAGIRYGQDVPVKIDAFAEPLMAKVAEIVPSVEPASRTFTVKLDLPSTLPVRSGQFGRALFPAGSRKVLTVPAAAVEERGQLQMVFVVEDSIARARLVTAGETREGSREVLSGLAAGERIAATRPAGLRDGVRVEE